MTKYQKIIRLAGLNLSQTTIALSASASKTTDNKVLKAAKVQDLAWPLDPKYTDDVLAQTLFPKAETAASSANKRMPDFAYIRKELLRNGVTRSSYGQNYSQYPYVETFIDKKQPSWIAAHVHMYEYFGGVAKILVPDNCKTTVVHNHGWKDQRINAVYHEMAELISLRKYNSA